MDLNISLIICAYNEEKYLGKCLDFAVKNSKGKFKEIVVIDNASTDRTKEIAESFPGVRVVREEKKGLSQARQRGYLEAKGDILAYIDADTEMGEDWTDIILKEFGENPDTGCLSGPYIYYDQSKFQQFLVRIYWYLLAYPTYFILGYMVVGGNFVIKKSVLEKMGGFDISVGLYGEDASTARRAGAITKVKFRLDFYMYSSARRLHGLGAFKTGYLYVLNFLSHVFLKRSVTDPSTIEDIR